MGKCKAKAIQVYLDTFRHNQAYPEIMQAHSKPCLTLASLELWYVHNSDKANISTFSQQHYF